MSNIDLLLEKFLTSYKAKVAGHFAEIYINPTRKELDEIVKAHEFNDIRFIADDKTKTLYCWNGGLLLHLQAWNNLAAEFKDTRKIYNNPFLMSGEVDYKNKSYDFYSTTLNDQKDMMYFWITDWTWCEKYLPKGLDAEMRREIRSKIWDENKEKLRKQGYDI